LQHELQHELTARIGLCGNFAVVCQVCDADREGGPMRTLTQFVLMAGGASMFPGLEERLGKELDARAMIPRDIYITSISAPERHHAAWIGGSLLASLPSFAENNFVQRADFLEEGGASVHKRCV
jgi:actin-related protein